MYGNTYHSSKLSFVLLCAFIMFNSMCPAQTSTTLSYGKISADITSLGSAIGIYDEFGTAAANIGDLNGDGNIDVAVGAPFDDDGGTDRGGVWIIFMDSDGTHLSYQKITDTEGSFSGTLDDTDRFGCSVASLGDLDDDGVVDIVVGADGDDDGGSARGALWILFLNTNGTVKSYQKISDTAGGFTGVLDDSDNFGDDVTCLGDLDGDGVADIAAGAPYDDDGGTNRGAVWILFLNTNGTVKSHQKISYTEGNLGSTPQEPPSYGPLNDDDNFGDSVACIGDLDGNGTPDIAVGEPNDYYDDYPTIYPEQGIIWVIFLDTDGTVLAKQNIGLQAGNFTGTIHKNDHFGCSVAGLGDIDGDGYPDIVAGAIDDDDGGTNTNTGAVWVLFMRPNGNVKTHQKFSDTEGGFTGTLSYGNGFGVSVCSLGDINTDGDVDIMVGAHLDRDYGSDRGAVWTLFLDTTPGAASEPGTSFSSPKILNSNASSDGWANDSLNFKSKVATDGAGNWVAVWDSDGIDIDPTVGDDSDIYVSRSLDNGVTWSTPAILNSNASTDGSGNLDLDPYVATDGLGNWITAWSSGGTGGTGLTVSRSTDNGATWTPQASAITAGGYETSGLVPTIATDGSGNWVMVWQTSDPLLGTDTNYNIGVATSTDNGATWSTPATLNSNAFEPSGMDEFPRIVTDGSGTWITVWEYISDIGYSISTDNGASWSNVAVAMTDCFWPSLATDNSGNWTIVAQTSGLGGIGCVYSSNDGASWSSEVTVSSGGSLPHIATDAQGNWMAVWFTIGTTDHEVMFAHSTDNGATWSAERVVNTTADSDTGKDFYPQIVTDNAGKWIVIWKAQEQYFDNTWIGQDNDIIFAVMNTGSDGGGGNFSSASSWAFGDVPGADDYVVIESSDTITLDANLTVAGLIINSGATFNCGSYTLTIADGGYFINNGTFNAGTGAIEFDGSSESELNLLVPTTFNDLIINSGVTLVEISAAANATVSGSLTNNGTIRKARGIISSGTKDFGLTGAEINVTGIGTLSSITVERIDSAAPDLDPGIESGAYWDITPSGSGFTVGLTLPHDLGTSHLNANVCRYNSSGEGTWEWGRTSSDNDTVTRTGITEMSTWAVGNSALAVDQWMLH